MRPQIHIENFAQFKQIKLDMSPFSIFSGQNGTGKTLLIKLYSAIKDSLLTGDNEFTSENIFKNTDIQLNKKFNNDETQELFSSYINYYLEPNRLLKNAFGHNNITLDKVEIRNLQFPQMELSISFHEDSQNSMVIANIKFSHEEFEEITEVSKVMYEGDDDFIHMIVSQSLIPKIIKKTLLKIVNKDMNIKISDRNVLYFPASREAYIRDYDQLINTVIMRHKEHIQKEMQSLLEGKSEQEVSRIVQGFLNSGFFKERNLFSEDPYIEKFCDILTKLPNKRLVENKEDIDLDYFKNNILKSNVVFKDGVATYELHDNISYSALNASSLENEYSIFYESLRKLDNNSYIIEEPEAHLSMINSMKLTLYLFSLFTKGYNFTLSTHSTVVIDSINYCYLLSKIEEVKRESLLKENDLPKNLKSLNSNLFENVSIYIIKELSVEEVPLTDYGFMIDDFANQIGQVNDLLYEIEQIYDEIDNEG